MWGFCKFVIAFMIFALFCVHFGIKASDQVSVIGIAILLGGFVAHSEGK